ncbi:Helix-turn-helix [Reichenbachiella faecimaris]|uniref:Helix-turn-helix n=1 Tax=Reichenbachiella faecimaris TaxID=692418 RepID=A0A1W2G734_REIFA|nr:helix-turn-helix transcriptional regulator [Reichenbachiella faecimaris]SMD32485.1 Helix-turn-helix [Reichenbachiella faecimaris]
MATLKQPQLGQTILNLRQEKKITQEELVDRCNVSVRTLQRIEAGEVTPRESTLKILLEALGYKHIEVEQSITIKKNKEILLYALIGGCVYFGLGFLETLADAARFESDLPKYFPLVYTIIKLMALTGYFFMMYGFATMHSIYQVSLLKISAYLMFVAFAIVEIYDVISIFSTMNAEEFMLVKGIEAVTFGGADIIFGIALFKLGHSMGTVAKVAGILEILVGMLFMSFLLAFMGLFLLIPATLLELVLLYKMHESESNKLISSTPKAI